MRLLFLGAGATGGYFGGRVANAGADVTFLVRPKRREQLARHGLKIEAPEGNLTMPVKAITREEISSPFDAVIVSAKAYDLASAIESIRPAVGDATVILPLLNGMKHLDALDAAFGATRVLGGLCHISVTLADDGTIRKLGDVATLTLGARLPEQRAPAEKLHQVLTRGTDAIYAENILAAIWEKWFFIAALASSTCLMRASVGEIVRTDGGPRFMADLLNECIAIATANGYPPRPRALEFAQTFMTDPASGITASMLRDIRKGGQIEADQIVGDIIRRGSGKGVQAPLLRTAYVHLQAYQNVLRASQTSDRT